MGLIIQGKYAISLCSGLSALVAGQSSREVLAGVVLEQLGVADVAGKHGKALVAALLLRLQIDVPAWPCRNLHAKNADLESV